MTQAYKSWVAKHGEEPRLPGLDRTNEQLLFMSFAQVWKENMGRESSILIRYPNTKIAARKTRFQNYL